MQYISSGQGESPYRWYSPREVYRWYSPREVSAGNLMIRCNSEADSIVWMKEDFIDTVNRP